MDKQTIKEIAFDSSKEALRIETYEMSGRRLYIDSWKKGLKIYEEARQHAGTTRFDMPILAPERSTLRPRFNESLQLFSADIPDIIRDLVAPVHYGQLQMLQILNRGENAALELAREAPVLIWILACATLTRQISLNQAVSLTSGKRVEIIRAIHPESTNSTLKLIIKVRPLNYCRNELRLLHRLLRDTDLRNNVRHLRQIVLPWLDIILDSPDIQSMPCIQQEIGNPNGSKYNLMQARTMYETCIQLGTRAGLPDVLHNLRNCKSLEELTLVSDAWNTRFNSRFNEQVATFSREQDAVDAVNAMIMAKRQIIELEKKRRKKELKKAKEEIRRKARLEGFQKPPVPGNQFISPITTVPELEREGELMCNCVASYREKIIFKNSYIYKVFYPERCTLEVTGKRWYSIGELKAPKNVAPHKHTRKYVQAWLDQYNNKAGSAPG
ncbi:MAG: PcfJ domain-containing protein [Desulfocapsaceae bacterium]|jgi:hypothetical protein|nr:PcfJ domain-containing protein [Desulfocapsaceae bacterium]